MAGPLKTRQLGYACRIYKNANDTVLAIDDLSVVADIRKITTLQWHRSAYLQSARTLFNLETGNRTIALIQMIGNYNSITEDSGDYLSATWDDSTGDANDVVISLEHMDKIGDTV